MGVALTDIISLIIRLIFAAVVLIAFIELVYAFDVIVKTNELDKVSVEISEGMMSSGYMFDENSQALTISRAIFSYKALQQLASPTSGDSYEEKGHIEPVRNCKYGAFFTFIDLEKNQFIASFGSREEGSSSSKSYFIGIQKENPDKTYSIVPGKMQIDVYDSPLSRTACAIESAWVTNQIQEIDPNSVLGSFERRGDAVFYQKSTLKNVASKAPTTETHDYMRWLPHQINFVESFSYWENIDPGKTPKKFLFIPINKDRYERDKNCVDWRTPGLENLQPQQSDIQRGNVIICIKVMS
ncbi:MAG: hypothetical protein HY831_03260 [Candidatus Aenigmarchaeota archaeon]|nr:hypothetical protein [Candidatus Aenigmarchaeota archaeon]